MVVSVWVVVLGLSVPVTPVVASSDCEGVAVGAASDGAGAAEDVPQPAAKTIALIRSMATRRLAVLFMKRHLSLWIHFTSDNVLLYFPASSTCGVSRLRPSLASALQRKIDPVQIASVAPCSFSQRLRSR